MKRASVLLGVTAALALVLMVTARMSSAADACTDGFTLTSGGVTEADTNGDGLTCEATVDASQPTLIAVDNGPAAPATFACPDQFLGPFPVGPIVGGDRNGNGFVCLKEVDSRLIAIDDTANPNADRS